MSQRRIEKNNALVAAIGLIHADAPSRYYIAGYARIHDSVTVTVSRWDDDQKALAAVATSNYDYAIVYDIEADLILKVKAGATPDPAAVAAQEWLRTAKMTHTGYQGEHDEGGAVFSLEGVPLSGPSVYDFGHRGKRFDATISPQRIYAAFTDELVRRWNRGPVPVRKPPLPDEDEE